MLSCLAFETTYTSTSTYVIVLHVTRDIMTSALDKLFSFTYKRKIS